MIKMSGYYTLSLIAVLVLMVLFFPTDGLLAGPGGLQGDLVFRPIKPW